MLEAISDDIRNAVPMSRTTSLLGADLRRVLPIPHSKMLRTEEEWARGIIAAHLKTQVRSHDDGSKPGMHDLEIDHSDGRISAVEVVAAADAESIEFWKLANGSDSRWQAEGIVGGWAVDCLSTARVKKLFADLPALLGSLESLGVCNFRTDSWQSADHPLVQQARDLGITRGYQGGTDYPGSIYLTVDLPAERRGGMVADNGDAASQWIGSFLSHPGQADVRAKLLSSGVDNRHVFVIVPGFTSAPFSVSDLLLRSNAPLPIVEPILPVEVTHVWMMGTWSSGTGLYWSPVEGWYSVSKAVGSNVPRQNSGR